MTREEHLEWAKQRALEYLPNYPLNAIGSMLSDMRKHPELAKHPRLVDDDNPFPVRRDAEFIREWIESFK